MKQTQFQDYYIGTWLNNLRIFKAIVNYLLSWKVLLVWSYLIKPLRVLSTDTTSFWARASRVVKFMPNNSTGQSGSMYGALDTVLSENSAITSTWPTNYGLVTFFPYQQNQLLGNETMATFLGKPISPIFRRHRRRRNASGWTPVPSALHNQYFSISTALFQLLRPQRVTNLRAITDPYVNICSKNQFGWPIASGTFCSRRALL